MSFKMCSKAGVLFERNEGEGKKFERRRKKEMNSVIEHGHHHNISDIISHTLQFYFNNNNVHFQAEFKEFIE